MSGLVEVAKVAQKAGEPRRRWFASEALDLLLWFGADEKPIGFQLSWRDGGKSRAVTAREGEDLQYEQVDEGERGGAGYARSATLHASVGDYDLSLIQPRFAALSRQLPETLRNYVLQYLGTPILESSTSTLKAHQLLGTVALVTRPLRQARDLVEALEAVGAQTRLLPMIAISPPPDAVSAAHLLRAKRRAEAWLFTSVNAVAAANNYLPARHWQAPVFAVGEATSQALKALGHTAQRPPPDAIHSEGLLSLPALQDVAGKTLLIVTGEGGRDGLREPLQARGATVEVATVYCRQLVPHESEIIYLTLDEVNALLLTSGEALVALHRALPTAQKARVLSLPLVVPSKRVKAMATALGFTRPLVAATVSTQAFVQALVDHHSTLT